MVRITQDQPVMGLGLVTKMEPYVLLLLLQLLALFMLLLLLCMSRNHKHIQ